MSAAAATRTARSGEAATRRIATLFMVGSACFAVASLPGVPRLTDRGVANAAAASSETLLGAVCFFAAAWLLRRADPS